MHRWHAMTAASETESQVFGERPTDFLQETRRAFDAAAPVYDAMYESLYGIRQIRRLTRDLFLRYFEPGDSLLELNCGTGNDAVFLGQQGRRVLATDLSPGMLAQAADKIEAAGLQRLVRTRLLPFDRLPELKGEVFDGAFSNLGGLNCTGAIDHVGRDLGALIRPGGYLIAAVMPSFSLWETTAFLARRRWTEAFRRMKPGGCAARLHGGTVRTFYYSPSRFLRAFAPCFSTVDLIGLNIFTPPPNAVNAHTVLAGAMSKLEKLDGLVARLAPFRAMGDHFAVVLRRKPA